MDFPYCVQVRSQSAGSSERIAHASSTRLKIIESSEIQLPSSQLFRTTQSQTCRGGCPGNIKTEDDGDVVSVEPIHHPNPYCGHNNMAIAKRKKPAPISTQKNVTYAFPVLPIIYIDIYKNSAPSRNSDAGISFCLHLCSCVGSQSMETLVKSGRRKSSTVIKLAAVNNKLRVTWLHLRQ